MHGEREQVGQGLLVIVALLTAREIETATEHICLVFCITEARLDLERMLALVDTPISE
jgi:hypothetical protein